MQKQVLTLLQNAHIDISSYGMHNRNEMLITNRVLPYYVMSYHKAGQATIRIEGKQYTIHPGEVVLFSPGVIHDHIVERGTQTELFWWHFTFQIGGLVDALRFFSLPSVSKVKNASAFEEIFENYCSYNQRQQSIPDILYEKARSFEILAMLFENILTESTPEISDIPETFFAILNEIINYPTADLSLEYLAGKFFLSNTYLSNRFKEYFGIAPIALHRERLIARAKEHLEAGEMNVNALSHFLGFESSQSFTRFFKSKTGVSPSEYRMQIKKHINPDKTII